MANRDMRPTLLGASLGSLLLLWVQWRVHLIAGEDQSIYLLPLVSLLGLLLLALPLRAMRPFFPSVFVLALLPVLQVFNFSSAAVNLLRHLTATILRVALFSLGLPVKGNGTVLSLYRGAVEVWGSCSGLESVKQLLMIAIIFAIAFPMHRFWQNILMCWTAICLAVLVNAIRIGVLLFLDGSPLVDRKYWFDLFHNGWPSLLFPGLATYFFVCIYVLWMERQVAEVENS
jgi:exosortase/archaeosortase family protein